MDRFATICTENEQRHLKIFCIPATPFDNFSCIGRACMCRIAIQACDRALVFMFSRKRVDTRQHPTQCDTNRPRIRHIIRASDTASEQLWRCERRRSSFSTTESEPSTWIILRKKKQNFIKKSSRIYLAPRTVASPKSDNFSTDDLSKMFFGFMSLCMMLCS